jgi:signal transduction histidine kinase
VTSLRARIAFVLVVSIVAVVGLATAVAILVLGPRGPDGFARSTAMQIEMLIPRRDGLAPNARSALLDAPAEGAPREHLTRMLRDALRAAGIPNRVVVTRPRHLPMAIVSVELADGWLTLPVPDDPPPGGPWLVLGGWMSLIVIGALAIALSVAHRIVRPLALLEAVAASIAPRGEMSIIPEAGPAEVRATARALNRLTTNLKAAMESRMRLVAAAGHDLRTPITRMRLRAEFLSDEERPAWLRDLDELRHIADSSIQLVHEEVEGKSGEPIRLDELTQTVVEELAAAGLAVKLAGSCPVLIRGAPLAMTRVLRNLLTNAATHGGGCEVSVHHQMSHAVVRIEDCGPGIPEAVIGRVFEPFFRIDPARQQPIPGAGLGLAIAKEIVARHDGEITLANRTSGGLRQELIFPRYVESSSQAADVRAFIDAA